MNTDLMNAVAKSLQKNHRNGPLNAKNLVGIYGHVIAENESMPADKIAELINDLELKSEGDEGDDDA